MHQMQKLDKIALGGGCHWCTEAVFQSLIGVKLVEQGFVASTEVESSFSEAVVVHYNPHLISLEVLIEIHLHTHKSTSDHSMRSKYRSAIYTYTKAQAIQTKQILASLKSGFEEELVTKVYPFISFKPSETQFVNYYIKNPNKPFCENYIQPKLQLLLQKFSDAVNPKMVESLRTTG